MGSTRSWARLWVGAMLAVSACSFNAPGSGSGGGSDDGAGDDGASSGGGSGGDGSSDGGMVDGSGSGSGSGEGGGGGTSAAGPCAGGGGCPMHASCDDSTGMAVCACDEGFFGGDTCAPLELPLLRVQMPCSPGCGIGLCTTPEDDQDTANLAGDPNVLYDVTVRIRGVVELKTYDGPGQDGFWHPGGIPNQDEWNSFGISVLDPDVTYWVNSGETGLRCYALDETHTIIVRGGTTVALHTENGTNTCAVQNHDQNGDAIVVPDVPPAPDPYDGQFVQVDIVSIMPH